MPSQYQQFVAEVRELIFFTLKLLFHWLALAIILIFVLVTLWIHQFFRQNFFTLEGADVDAKEEILSPHSVPSNREALFKKNHTQRRGTRRKKTHPQNCPRVRDLKSDSIPLSEAKE